MCFVVRAYVGFGAFCLSRRRGELYRGLGWSGLRGAEGEVQFGLHLCLSPLTAWAYSGADRSAPGLARPGEGPSPGADRSAPGLGPACGGPKPRCRSVCTWAWALSQPGPAQVQLDRPLGWPCLRSCQAQAQSGLHLGLPSRTALSLNHTRPFRHITN